MRTSAYSKIKASKFKKLCSKLEGVYVWRPPVDYCKNPCQQLIPHDVYGAHAILTLRYPSVVVGLQLSVVLHGANGAHVQHHLQPLVGQVAYPGAAPYAYA